VAVGDGGIKIVDKTKITVASLATNLASLQTDLQTFLRGSTFANNDIIYQIIYERNKNNNDVMVYVVFEDQ
tara:strand:- start:523 stop:735 length:213 start_codon:yes stop_codon:yes gene_type:complete